MEKNINLHAALNYFRGIGKVIDANWQLAANSIGLTQAELHTLWIIYFEERASITTIATYGLWDRSTVMQVVKRLKEKSLVLVEKDEQDLRVSYVTLTEEGKRRQGATAMADFHFYQTLIELREEDEEGFNQLIRFLIRFNCKHHSENYVYWVEKTANMFAEKF